MSTMQAELYDALIEGGTSEPKARAAAEAAAHPKFEDMATKIDLAELEARLTWRMVSSTGIIVAAIAALAVFD